MQISKLSRSASCLRCQKNSSKLFNYPAARRGHKMCHPTRPVGELSCLFWGSPYSEHIKFDTFPKVIRGAPLNGPVIGNDKTWSLYRRLILIIAYIFRGFLINERLELSERNCLQNSGYECHFN